MKAHRISVAALVFVIAAMSAAYAQETAEELYQAGLYQEEVQGNLESAIDLYRRIVEDFPDNRPVAAQALMHIGLCHEKLGSREAQRAYERLVRDYGDQTEVAARARARLADLQGLARAEAPAGAAAASGIVVRELWAGRGGPEVDASGGPSPDGRYLAYIDWTMTAANIAVRDLVTGESRRLTDHPGYFDGFPLRARYSPDGESIVYTWWPADSAVESRLVSIDGSSSRTLCSDPDHMFWPVAWASDGQQIAVSKVNFRGVGPSEIAWASVDDCSLSVFKTFKPESFEGIEPAPDWYPMWRAALSPDDRHFAFERPVPRDDSRYDLSLVATDGSAEVSLVEHPADDRIVGWLPGTSYLLFGSDRAGEWDLYAIEVVDGRVVGSPRIVRRSVGQAAPMGFTVDGSLYYSIQRLRSTASIAPFDAESGRVRTDAAQPLLGSNSEPDWSPNGKYLTYWRMADLPSGPSDWNQVLVVRDLETGEERDLATHLEVEMPRWSRDGRSVVVIGIERARSDSHAAAVYRIDVESGEVETLLEFAPEPQWWIHTGAVETAEGDGVLYVREGRLVLHDLVSNEETELFRHPGVTSRLLSVSPDGQSLLFAVADSTDEYVRRGTPPRLTNVTGKFMIVDLPGGELRELLEFDVGGAVQNLEWGPDGAYAYFTEELENMTILRRVPVEGGDVEQVWVSQQSLHDFTVGPQGQRVAYTARENIVGIYVMENLVAALSNEE
ncbi:MAG: tetratricopeptide repeat protein [Gemmatimonadota bacterium]|nr:MAG: tetratricopeptide repeat protein [Gemmatimonadota bacterium]